MRCHACQGAIELRAGERVGFRDTCDACGADLHACVQCRHHEPRAYNECREPGAERVRDRQRANRCDYFSPGDGGGDREDGRSRALSAADALFRK
jgi:hypothetical protein